LEGAVGLQVEFGPGDVLQQFEAVGVAFPFDFLQQEGIVRV
jgi:hypothetical protein